MKRILENQLLFGTITAFLLYVTLGITVPGPYIPNAASILLLIGGGLACWKYVPPAFEIVVLNRRVEEVVNERDYYPVYGSALLALGSVYTGMFGLGWSTGMIPADWAGTWVSRMGHALMALGFFFLWAGPSAPKEGLRLPNVLWLVFVTALVIFSSILVGIKIATPDDTDLIRFFKVHGENRAACSSSRPIWGTSKHRYHTPMSPYRGMVTPQFCFETEEEAMQAGFVSGERSSNQPPAPEPPASR